MHRPFLKKGIARRVSVGLLVAMMALSMSACGKGSDDANETDTEGTEAVSDSDGAATEYGDADVDSDTETDDAEAGRTTGSKVYGKDEGDDTEAQGADGTVSLYNGVEVELTGQSGIERISLSGNTYDGIRRIDVTWASSQADSLLFDCATKLGTFLSKSGFKWQMMDGSSTVAPESYGMIQIAPPNSDDVFATAIVYNDSSSKSMNPMELAPDAMILKSDSYARFRNTDTNKAFRGGEAITDIVNTTVDTTFGVPSYAVVLWDGDEVDVHYIWQFSGFKMDIQEVTVGDEPTERIVVFLNDNSSIVELIPSASSSNE